MSEVNELEAIRARHEEAEQDNNSDWAADHGARAHFDRETLLRLLDAAREELAEERAKISAWTDDERRAMRAAILAYLSALVEDEGAILAVTIAIATTSDVSPEKTEDYEAGETTNMYDVARAVLRTLATRAQGESS